VVRYRPCVYTGASHLFCVNDFAERCNEKEAKNEETNFVKWVVQIVRRGFKSFGCGGHRADSTRYYIISS